MHDVRRNRFVTSSSGSLADRPCLRLCAAWFLRPSMFLLLIKLVHCLKKKKKRIIMTKRTLLGLLASTESSVPVLHFLWADLKVVSAQEHLLVTLTCPHPAAPLMPPSRTHPAAAGPAHRLWMEPRGRPGGTLERRGVWEVLTSVDSGAGRLGLESWLCAGCRSGCRHGGARCRPPT